MAVYRVVLEYNTDQLEAGGRRPWIDRTPAERLETIRHEVERIYAPLPRLIAERTVVSVKQVT